ncbi:hypothetical protein RRSWK_05505 [Rhodopirellula sp. SWK7]|nr:hypothetical protein RRSWK_05505 [Rhodopirellula sp. SWK7]
MICREFIDGGVELPNPGLLYWCRPLGDKGRRNLDLHVGRSAQGKTLSSFTPDHTDRLPFV